MKRRWECQGREGSSLRAFLLSCLSGTQLPLPCPHLWRTARLSPPYHPSPRTETLLPNQLLNLVTEILEESLPFLLQKIVSRQGEGCSPREPLYLGLVPAGPPTSLLSRCALWPQTCSTSCWKTCYTSISVCCCWSTVPCHVPGTIYRNIPRDRAVLPTGGTLSNGGKRGDSMACNLHMSRPLRASVSLSVKQDQ